MNTQSKATLSNDQRAPTCAQEPHKVRLTSCDRTPPDLAPYTSSQPSTDPGSAKSASHGGESGECGCLSEEPHPHLHHNHGQQDMGSCIGTGEPTAFASLDAPCGLQENQDHAIGNKDFSNPSAPTIGTPYTTPTNQKIFYGKSVDDLNED